MTFPVHFVHGVYFVHSTREEAMKALRLGLGALALWLAAGAGAAPLDRAAWRVTDLATNEAITTVTDDRADTRWPGAWGKGLLVDLGRETAIHRVYLTPGDGPAAEYQELRLSFARAAPNDPAAVMRSYTQPACAWWQVAAERRKLLAAGTGDFLCPGARAADLRFNPIIARYLRLEGAAPIAELEVYGSADADALTPRDAVVLPDDAPDVLRVAAEDLRYYVGELTGRPLPIIARGQDANYPGTLFRLVDWAPTVKSFAEWEKQRDAGAVVASVNVERAGREVLFSAFPYRHVAFSVWEFLRRQGVVWSAAADHADFVPCGKGVNLELLPLRYQPSAPRRKACFDIPAPPAGFWNDEFLFFLRNGYDESWGTLQGFLASGKETPADPLARGRDPQQKDLDPRYREGFVGHPHNLQAVVPDRLLKEHAEWCGQGADGQRRAPSQGGPGTFCFTNPELIQFVADKMVYWSGDDAASRASFRLVPGDGSSFCQCERCLALCPPGAATMAYCAGPRVVSGPYFHFIAEVARRVREARPQVAIEALAYADYTPAPANVERFPDNVFVAICVYGVRNLPLGTAAANAPARAYLEAWAGKTARRGYWDYLLIHSEWRPLTMPVPLVTAMVDRMRYLGQLGMLGQGDTQADRASLVHNPWNRYAHPRLLWDLTLTPERLLDEFFTAYYGPAKAPMLAYYQALEAHLLKGEVSLEDFAYDLGPNPAMFTPELVTALRAQLTAAEQAATSWVVRPRVALARADFEWAVPAALRRSPDRAVAFAHGKRQLIVPRRRAGIRLDGKLNDAGWQGVPAATGFAVPGKAEVMPAAEQTAFRVTWDDEQIYLAVRGANPNAAKLQSVDNVWGMDNVEVFLVPDAGWGATYYQLAVNAGGKVWGPKRFRGSMWARDETELPPPEVAAERGEGAWVVELSLPFGSLGVPAPKPGDAWRCNVIRNGSKGSSWSALPMAMWHLFRDFDFIAFE